MKSATSEGIGFQLNALTTEAGPPRCGDGRPDDGKAHYSGLRVHRAVEHLGTNRRSLRLELVTILEARDQAARRRGGGRKGQHEEQGTEHEPRKPRGHAARRWLAPRPGAQVVLLPPSKVRTVARSRRELRQASANQLRKLSTVCRSPSSSGVSASKPTSSRARSTFR